MKKFLFITLGIILMGVGCQKGTWQGYYYPNGCLTCTENYIYSPSFSSLEKCRDWANETKQKLGNNPNDDYECGLNCKEKDGFNICKETKK